MRTASPSRGLAYLLVTAMAMLAGCNCQRATVVKAKGDPKFAEATPKDPHLSIDQTGKKLTVDFGYTLVNQEKPNARLITIKNDGVGAVEIQKLVKADDFNSDVFKTPNANEVQKTIPSGGSITFTVAFAPTEAKEYKNTFTLQSNVDEEGSTSTDGLLTVELKGTGVSNGCILQPADNLEFGNVKNGTSYQKRLVVQNTTPLDWTFTFQGVTGTDKDEFSTDLAVGETVIKSNDSLTLTVTFIANHPGSSSANLQFSSSADMCAPVPFALHANGVDSLITATPNPVDFGFVDPAADWGSVAQEVTLTNIGNDPVTLIGSDTGLICDKTWSGNDTTCDATAEFANNPDGVISSPGDFNMLLNPNEPQKVTLYFKPARLHSAAGHMQFKLDPSTTQGTFGFDLKGVGGGPKIQVTPATVDYGAVAVGVPQNRTVVVTNIGSSPANQPDSFLKVTELSITPDTGTDQTEFTVVDTALAEVPKSLGANQRWPVAISFNPLGAGTKSATLHVKSNDPTKPDVAVHLQAEGQQLPPCTYSITPPSLNFGNVQPGRNRILSFRIKNENPAGSGQCLFSALDLSPDTTNPPYSLVDGPVASKLVDAQGTWDVEVKFAPTQSAGDFPGAITFYSSSADHPQGTVQLNGGSSPGCLLITPDDLDFGTVQVGCASRERTFTIYNVCNSTVTVSSIDMMPDATNRCPDVGGNHTCPFRITQAPAFPKTIAVGGSVDFKMKFQPGQPETDVASLAVQTVNLSSPYVVTLHGVGATNAIQTDIFRQDAQPKVDVLLAVDDSCSMSDKQQALAANFQSFIQFAISQQVDYHIGVTSTSVSQGGFTTCPASLPSSPIDSLAPCGLLAPIDGSRSRVLTNTTPNLEQVFGQNVNLGISGDATEAGFEGIYEALSAPNVTGWNSGFLRDEANLAAVVVSDASDQSPNTFDFYKNFFLNIKGFRRTNAFTFSAVSSTGSNPPPGAGSCVYDGTNVDPNPYQLMAQETNGVFQEICTSDWASSLRQLGQSAFGYRTRFFLSETPDTSFSIDVQLDGVDYPATTPRGTVQWTYNAGAGAIDFQPLAVPEPGSTLTVSYHVLCYPTTP